MLLLAFAKVYAYAKKFIFLSVSSNLLKGSFSPKGLHGFKSLEEMLTNRQQISSI